MASSILTPQQQAFLACFGKSGLTNALYFTGGTALSHFYLQHRLSEDLDFFSLEEIDIQAVTVFIASLKTDLGFESYDFQNSFNRNIFLLRFIDKSFLKVEFTYYPFLQIETPINNAGILTDSLIDIAANKLFTIAQKPRGRDYFDLFSIHQKQPLDLDDLRLKAKTKFDWHIDPLQLGTQFNRVDTFLDDPILSTAKVFRNTEMIAYFKSSAQVIGKEVLK
jgi:predicted nucleotidyltransferase component of viral defense system